MHIRHIYEINFIYLYHKCKYGHALQYYVLKYSLLCKLEFLKIASLVIDIIQVHEIKIFYIMQLFY